MPREDNVVLVEIDDHNTVQRLKRNKAVVLIDRDSYSERKIVILDATRPEGEGWYVVTSSYITPQNQEMKK